MADNESAEAWTDISTAAPSQSARPAVIPPLRRGPAYAIARPPAIPEGQVITWRWICGYAPSSINKGGFLYVTDKGNVYWKVAWWDFGASSWSFPISELVEVTFVGGSWEQKAEDPWKAGLRTQAILHLRDGSTYAVVPPLIGLFLERARGLVPVCGPEQAIAQAATEVASGELPDPSRRKGVDRVTVHSSHGLAILAAIAFVATLGLFVPIAYDLASHVPGSATAVDALVRAVPILLMWALVVLGLIYRFRRGHSKAG